MGESTNTNKATLTAACPPLVGLGMRGRYLPFNLSDPALTEALIPVQGAELSYQ